MIKQLSNSVIAKYCDLSMSRRSIICLSLRLRQIIDLLATDKSQYFAQPRPIIVNYFVCIRIDKGDVLAIESKQVIEMKEGNTIAPYTFRRVSNTTFPITLLSREVIRRKLLLF